MAEPVAAAPLVAEIDCTLTLVAFVAAAVVVVVVMDAARPWDHRSRIVVRMYERHPSLPPPCLQQMDWHRHSSKGVPIMVVDVVVAEYFLVL